MKEPEKISANEKLKEFWDDALADALETIQSALTSELYNEVRHHFHTDDALKDRIQKILNEKRDFLYERVVPMDEVELDSFLRKHSLFESLLIETGSKPALQQGYLSMMSRLLERPGVSAPDTFQYSFPAAFAVTRHERFQTTAFHKHDYIEMVYVYSGTCRQRIEAQENLIILQQDDLMILNPNVVHTIDPAGEDDVIINLLISREFCDPAFLQMIAVSEKLSDLFTFSLLGRKDYYSYMIFHTASNKEIRRLIIRILLEFNTKNPYYIHVIKGYLVALFFELMRQSDADQSVVTNLTATDRKMTDILRYMENNLAHLTLQQAAAHFHLNERT